MIAGAGPHVCYRESRVLSQHIIETKKTLTTIEKGREQDTEQRRNKRDENKWER